MVEVEDCYKLKPAFNPPRSEELYTGEVISIHNNRYARVRFGEVVECFFLFDLEMAQKVRRKKHD